MVAYDYVLALCERHLLMPILMMSDTVLASIVVQCNPMTRLFFAVPFKKQCS